MTKALALCCIAALSLCAQMAWSQTVLERVLLLLDRPGMLALNILETGAFLGPLRSSGPVFSGVDGSISTVIYGLGVRDPDLFEPRYLGLRQAILAVDLGFAETTAIGGVNTGAIGFAPVTPDVAMLGSGIALGVQTALDEVQTVSAHAVAAGAHTMGGSAGSAYLAANMASNAMRVQGQVTQVLSAVSVTMADIRATGLGAVNTGAIVSGVDTTVRGITGMSGSGRKVPEG